MKKAIRLVLAAMMLLFSAMSVLAYQDEAGSKEMEAYAIDSFTGEVLGKVSYIEVSEERAAFFFGGQEYAFPIKEFGNDQSKEILTKTYYGEKDQLTCCVAEYEGAYCIKIANKAKSIENRKKDRAANLTVIYAQDIEKWLPEIEDYLSEQEKRRNELAIVDMYGVHHS